MNGHQTSDKRPFSTVDTRKYDPPPDMYSRSFMYVKVKPPNMRLDISQPRQIEQQSLISCTPSMTSKKSFPGIEGSTLNGS
jgi:hypothetical protein